jgi:hypothetical protein
MAEPSVATALRCALADLEAILPEYDPEHELSAWETLAELRTLVDSEERLQAADRYDPATQIVIVWSVEDVLEVRPDLAEEQAIQVLRLVDKHHDASIGTNWETLESFASDLFGEAPPEQE